VAFKTIAPASRYAASLKEALSPATIQNICKIPEMKRQGKLWNI
jgi:hypothetical protein